MKAYDAAICSGVSASREFQIPRAVGRHDIAVAHGLPLLVEFLARVVRAAPFAKHFEAVSGVPYAVQESVGREERCGVADRTDENPVRQGLPYQRDDPFGFGRRPAHTADEDQPGAVVRQRLRIAVGGEGHAADRAHGNSPGRRIPHGVASRASRHNAAAKRRGEECRLPVGELVE